MIGKYIDAVNGFLKRKNHTDAYQIVTDILDESPENTYALSMLQSMTLTKKKIGTNLQLFSVLAVIIAVALWITAFELGRSADDEHSIYGPINNLGVQGNTLLHLDQKEKKVVVNSPALFRYTKDAAAISGIVRCKLPLLEGTLSVDGQKMELSRIKHNEIACTLSQGIHTFEWNNSQTGITSVETVHLLPFENKRIEIGTLPEQKQGSISQKQL
jgi:hypothetical protein